MLQTSEGTGEVSPLLALSPHAYKLNAYAVMPAKRREPQTMTPLRDVARLGLVHHMLFPEEAADPDRYANSLREFIARTDIDTFDCCAPRDIRPFAGFADLVRVHEKHDITFAIHLFPFKELSLCEPDPDRNRAARTILAGMIEQAQAVGAARMIVASGRPPENQHLDACRKAFRETCRWMCERLTPAGITLLIEPFDTAVDKCFLYGPTIDCTTLVQDLRDTGADIGIELDIAHLPLMNETISDAIHTVAPVLQRVHLGNCVLRNPDHPLYGDKHPPIGYPEGEINVPEITEALKALCQCGFLSKTQPGSLLLEMTPWPGRTVEQTVDDSMNRLNTAWQRLQT
jgi:sugar phosphate isomerase/epimerase